MVNIVLQNAGRVVDISRKLLTVEDLAESWEIKKYSRKSFQVEKVRSIIDKH